ncbi:chromate transporter [Acidiphilium acidophilum]|uniref:Chromate transporter n=1 Tax=Acidiphilium acidophilum TaxID=76588 RepID=A0AAW9DSJ9_ACIAO|nr:chromate transporter [Acidiphilium acidophilum]MDX5931282.1 chromate transporter [Acidiphilium acidophilum]GBQ30068.1 chromate transport protein ChrA [Acidiphilium acidophilum DSM 700]
MVDVAPQASPDRLSRSALFNGFFIAGLSGFGGVLPFARRIIVERKRWLTDAEFADLFSLCQFLPGPNIVNLAAAFGARHRGASGALAAMGGLLAAPVTIVILLGLLFERYGCLPDVHHGLEGLAAAAAGLILATALKIAAPSLRGPTTLAVVILAFTLFAVLHLRLPIVIALSLPVSLVLAARRIR